MLITQKTVANKLAAYLHHEQSLAELVGWAESALMNGDFEERHLPRIRDVVARVGLADVRAFGLTWEDCEQFLKQLGFAARIEIVAARSRSASAVVREKPGRKYGR